MIAFLGGLAVVLGSIVLFAAILALFAILFGREYDADTDHQA